MMLPVYSPQQNDIISTNYEKNIIDLDIGNGEIVCLNVPTLTINDNNTTTTCPPNIFKQLEGEIIGKSFTYLTRDRVVIIDWTVFNDDWDEEQWSVLSWVVVIENSIEHLTAIKENVAIMVYSESIINGNTSVKQYIETGSWN